MPEKISGLKNRTCQSVTQSNGIRNVGIQKHAKKHLKKANASSWHFLWNIPENETIFAGGALTSSRNLPH